MNPYRRKRQESQALKSKGGFHAARLPLCRLRRALRGSHLCAPGLESLWPPGSAEASPSPCGDPRRALLPTMPRSAFAHGSRPRSGPVLSLWWYLSRFPAYQGVSSLFWKSRARFEAARRNPGYRADGTLSVRWRHAVSICALGFFLAELAGNRARFLRAVGCLGLAACRLKEVPAPREGRVFCGRARRVRAAAGGYYLSPANSCYEVSCRNVTV